MFSSFLQVAIYFEILDYHLQVDAAGHRYSRQESTAKPVASVLLPGFAVAAVGAGVDAAVAAGALQVLPVVEAEVGIAGWAVTLCCRSSHCCYRLYDDST